MNAPATATAAIPLNIAEQEQDKAMRYHVSDPLPLYPIAAPSKPYPVAALGSILSASQRMR